MLKVFPVVKRRDLMIFTLGGKHFPKVLFSIKYTHSVGVLS